jgi:hypothetical protein
MCMGPLPTYSTRRVGGRFECEIVGVARPFVSSRTESGPEVLPAKARFQFETCHSARLRYGIELGCTKRYKDGMTCELGVQKVIHVRRN